MFGKNLEITPMEALFLMVLNRGESISGSEIVQKINEDLGTDWSPTPGATYKIVQSLEKKEFIKETTASEHRKDQRIRTYTLTKKGQGMIPTIAFRIRKIVAFTEDCCPGEGMKLVLTDDEC